MSFDLALLNTVRSGEVVELGHQMYRGMPGLSTHPPYVFSTFKAHGDVINEDGTSASNEVLFMGGHSGTHIDALGHVSCGLKLHGGHDAAAHQTGQDGLKVCGIEETEPLLLRGVLIDVTNDGKPVAPEHVVGVDEVSAADVRPGDAVLIRTGWAQYFTQPGVYGNVEAGIPGLGLEAATWLADRNVRLIGADNIALEPFKAPVKRLPVHNLLLVERGIQIAEMLDLEELARRRVTEFMFVAIPLALRGATASPVRPIALL